MALPAEKAQYTFADVLAWDDNERAEIIDGNVIMLATPSTDSPADKRRDFRSDSRLSEREKHKVIQAPFVRLFEQDGNSPDDMDTVVEPDITVVCDLDKLDGKGCNGKLSISTFFLNCSSQNVSL